MRDLLQYVFGSEDYKRTDLRKPALIALVMSKYDDYLKGNISTVVAPTDDNNDEVLVPDAILSSDEEGASEEV